MCATVTVYVWQPEDSLQEWVLLFCRESLGIKLWLSDFVTSSSWLRCP